MDAFHHPASRLGNIVHKNPTYVPLHLTDASDQEFFNSELQREGQQQATSTNPQQQQRGANGAGGPNKPSSPAFPASPPVKAPPQVASTGSQFVGSHAERDAHMVELHGQPATPPASVQTMVEGAVKLVTMLNFMKVELGDRKTLRSKEQWRAAGAELIGTMLFVYLGCGSVVATGMLSLGMSPSRLIAIALAHGLAIAFLAGATGAISGGHLNPAVTLAFVIAGKETLLRAGLYVGAQV
ncbi:hypothetical protein L7F22_068320 [Adiantum nelumboides]|nr:hypothetical protein [Adiantum nelumboides]